MADVGYIRLNTGDQGNYEQLTNVYIDKLFIEHANFTVKNRPVFLECIDFLCEGDTLHIQSFDIIARNIEELLNITLKLNYKGVTVRFHSEKLIFEAMKDKTSILDGVQFQMLNSLAWFEYKAMRQRQQEGIARAKMSGRNLGRPVKITEELKEAIRQRLDKHGIAAATVAKEFGLSVSSIYQIKRNKRESIMTTSRTREKELSAALADVFEQLAKDPLKGVEISPELAEYMGPLYDGDDCWHDIAADDHLLTITEDGEAIYEGE